jgi:hypothetical protein
LPWSWSWKTPLPRHPSRQWRAETNQQCSIHVSMFQVLVVPVPACMSIIKRLDMYQWDCDRDEVSENVSSEGLCYVVPVFLNHGKESSQYRSKKGSNNASKGNAKNGHKYLQPCPCHLVCRCSHSPKHKYTILIPYLCMQICNSSAGLRINTIIKNVFIACLLPQPIAGNSGLQEQHQSRERMPKNLPRKGSEKLSGPKILSLPPTNSLLMKWKY